MVPDATPTQDEALAPKPPMHVIVCGTGPGGLLCAINLLRRNVEGEAPRYTVELLDGGEDFGALDGAGLQRKRSWMIGLAWPGLRAIRRVPGLYDLYVSKVGVQVKQLALYLGSKKILTGSGAADTDAENYLVDRNFIVHALARYLNDNYGTSKHLTRRYRAKVQFVDADARRVFVRSADGTEGYAAYDLLVGADGVRSAVRAALVAGHRDFDCAVSDSKPARLEPPRPRSALTPHCAAGAARRAHPVLMRAALDARRARCAPQSSSASRRC